MTALSQCRPKQLPTCPITYPAGRSPGRLRTSSIPGAWLHVQSRISYLPRLKVDVSRLLMGLRMSCRASLVWGAVRKLCGALPTPVGSPNWTAGSYRCAGGLCGSVGEGGGLQGKVRRVGRAGSYVCMHAYACVRTYYLCSCMCACATARGGTSGCLPGDTHVTVGFTAADIHVHVTSPWPPTCHTQSVAVG